MNIPQHMPKELLASLAFLAASLVIPSTGCRADFPASLLGDGGRPDSSVDANPLPDSGVDAAPQPDSGTDASLLDSALPDGTLQDSAPPDGGPVCGNGVKDPGEACDDGNQDSGDGCSASCEIECSNGSTTDCNLQGQTLVASSAFVDQDPPDGFIQCAGFENTPENDVGPHWDGNCIGAAHTLRIRYWDTSTNPWTLLGDATLHPDLTADYSEQTFDATNFGGTQGVFESQEFVMLPDDPQGSGPLSQWSCTSGPASKHYQATDLYFENRAGNTFVLVSGFSTGDDASAIMSDRAEIARYVLGFEECFNNAPTPDRNVAIALYYQR